MHPRFHQARQPRFQNITNNGVFAFGSSPSGTESLRVNGDFGGGSVTVGYMVGEVFQPYAEGSGPFAAPFEMAVDCGKAVKVALEVTGATVPNINAGSSPVGG